MVINLDKKRAQMSAVAAGSVATVAVASPAFAQTAAPSSIAEVNSMVTALGGVAAATVTVVLGAMAARMVIKLVNRVSVKG